MNGFETTITISKTNEFVIYQENVRADVAQTVILDFQELIDLGWTPPKLAITPDLFNDGFDSKHMHQDLFQVGE